MASFTISGESQVILKRSSVITAGPGGPFQSKHDEANMGETLREKRSRKAVAPLNELPYVCCKGWGGFITRDNGAE